MRTALLSSAMRFVPQFGWTTNAITAAAHELGISPMAHGMLGRGPIDLVYHFIEKSNRDSIKTLSTESDFDKFNRSELIEKAIKTRLQENIPYLDHWPQAMAMGALPQNSLETAKILVNWFDDIVHFANDKAVRSDWYISRAAVGSVYIATELFLISDRSQDNINTWVFLSDTIKSTVMAAAIPVEISRQVKTAGSILCHGLSEHIA